MLTVVAGDSGLVIDIIKKEENAQEGPLEESTLAWDVVLKTDHA